MYILKRSGRREKFDGDKIRCAIEKANLSVGPEDRVSKTVIGNIVDKIESLAEVSSTMFDVDHIETAIEDYLININKYQLAKSYIKYRHIKQLARDKYSELMETIGNKVACKNIVNQNANIDEHSFGGRIGETSSLVMKQYALDFCVSKQTRDNHLNNEVYIHDLDSYAVGSHNCLSIPFDKLLKEGFDTRQTDVRTAGSLNTAMQLVAVIIQLQSLQQFGGVSATHIDWTLVPYVRKSFRKHFIDGLKYLKKYNEDKANKIVSKYTNNSKELEFENRLCKKGKFKQVYKYAIEQTEREAHQATEALYHNLNTLQSRSGNQLPFSSINLGTCTLPEGRLMSKELLSVCLEGLGKYHKTSIFPCVIFQCKKGLNRKPGDKNYDLFQLACKCTASRLYPNYANCDWSVQQAAKKFDVALKKKVLESLSMKDRATLIQKLDSDPVLADLLGLHSGVDGNIIVEENEREYEINSTMGCRTWNGADINYDEIFLANIRAVIDGKPLPHADFLSAAQKQGRGNICPTTIILPTIAMRAGRDVEAFMKLLEKKIDQARESLMDRFEWMCSQSADSAKYMYQNRTMVGYEYDGNIRNALKHGTLVIGMLGMAECLQLLVGCDQTSDKGMELAKRICQLYKDKCAAFKSKYKMNFGVYYTPAEGLCGTAMEKFKKEFGIIDKVSDHDYFTNSIHVPVWHSIDAFAKIDIESKLTGYSSAGCITYVELDSSVKNNPQAIEDIVNYMMDKDIPYGAINVPVDSCKDCGYEEEIPTDYCPVCGGTNITRLRRVTGYLSGDYKSSFNYAKQKETEQRVKHSGVSVDKDCINNK